MEEAVERNGEDADAGPAEELPGGVGAEEALRRRRELAQAQAESRRRRQQERAARLREWQALREQRILERRRRALAVKLRRLQLAVAVHRLGAKDDPEEALAKLTGGLAGRVGGGKGDGGGGSGRRGGP